MLTDDELKELLEPLLEALNELDQEIGDNLTQIPQVHFMMDPASMENLRIGDYDIDEETLQQIEDYIQSYIENRYHPTMLH